TTCTYVCLFSCILRCSPISTLFPYTTLFRSGKLPAGDLARRQIPDAFWRQLPGDNILRRVLVRPHRESRRLVGDVVPRRELIRTACLSNIVRALHAVGRLGQGMVTDVFVRGRLRQHLKVYRRVLLPVPTASNGP